MDKISKNQLILDKVQEALESGKRLNRENLEDLNITEKNKSLHSYISDIQNKRLVPVETEWSSQNPNKDYFMMPDEIERFKNPEQRIIQREEIRAKVEKKRRERQIKSLIKLIEKIERYPYIFPYFESAINDFIIRFKRIRKYNKNQ
jgi:hypothetical protein